jgi:hypothetical protein
VYLSGIDPESNSTKYLSLAYSGVQIIYFEHETSD